MNAISKDFVELLFSQEGAPFKYPERPVRSMNPTRRAVNDSRAAGRALSMVLLMVLMSMAPLLTLPTVSAHAEPSGVTWPLEGSNDTGWVTLDATGANTPGEGAQATADWNLSFAPGAQLSNVTLEIRVSGENGMVIEEPLLAVDGMGTSLFDWSGFGTMGESNQFDSGAVYEGRLNPNSNSDAGWTLPSDAEITEMVIQALAPVDPAVSLRPVETTINDYAIHPELGFMYVAANNDLLMIDANANPTVIDMVTFDSAVVDMELDATNNLIHFLTAEDGFFAMSLTDSSTQVVLPEASDAAFEQLDEFAIASTGDVYAANQDELMLWNGVAWTKVSDMNGACLAMLEVNGVLYISMEGAGVARYDLVSGQMLSTWSTANNLHSDQVTQLMISGNQILFASSDAGLARYDWSSGFWLSTWSDSNWLDSSDIAGLARVGDELFILNGPSLHTYNTTTGIFSTTHALSDFGLQSESESMMLWSNLGPASPSQTGLLVSDGEGTLAHLTPGNNPIMEGSILLSSGPTTDEMGLIEEINGILYITGDDGAGINRFDTGNTLWLAPWPLAGDVLAMGSDGTDLFLGTSNSTVVQHSSSGTVLNQWNGQGCWATGSDFLSIDINANSIVVSLENGGFASIDRSTATCVGYDSTNWDSSSILGDVVLNGGKAYVATEDKGILRYDIANDSWLEPWGSTGINGVDYAGVAMVGNILHLGLQGYGVVRKDISTGEILSPFLASGRNAPLPSSNIYALASDGYNLYIGTQQGARKWDGSQMTNFGQGSSWQTRPTQFYDFAVEASISGGSLYAGTNIGVCKYSIATMAINDCQNVQDGMPNWAAYSVHYDNNYVYGGTTSGVGLITKSTFQHDFNWGEGTQTENAVVEVMGDIAYIGTDGLGVLRYNITSNLWLTPFNEDNGVLDGGNDDVTGMVADIRQNLLWIGGSDGFQLINVTTGGEAYDIEKSSGLYDANGDPFGMIIHNNIMYYHSKTASDEVSRLDVLNLTNLGNLDIGQQVGENQGDIVGMNLVGDVLMTSVVSPQWWNADGSGGIGRWNTTSNSFENNILPTGSIDRVTSYRSTTGNTWVAWGELKLDLYAPNGTLISSWDNYELPVRGIVEYDGHVLFAAEDGIHRYNETSNQWAAKWTAGNGLPTNAGTIFYELWTDGSSLVVGGARFQGWGGFAEGIISLRDSTGAWSSYAADSYTNMPDGYPISMEMCGGALNIAMYNNNGGVARIDIQNQTVLPGFDRSQLDGTSPASVTCDSSDTLYIGYYNDNQPISKYSFSSNAFLPSLTTASHNLPSDRIWYDSLAHANGQLIVGHGIGNGGSNLIGGGYSIMSSNGATTTQANVQSGGSSVTSFQWLGGTTGWMMGQAGGSSGYSHVSTLSTLGMQKIVDLPGLVSGQITAMAGNSTHIWAATGGQSAQGQFSGNGAGILQGTFQPNGDVQWEYGWAMAANSRATDFHLQGNQLYIASNPTGLMKLDVTNRNLAAITGALHDKFDQMQLYNNHLVIGLAGEGGSPPGVQTFDLNTQQFDGGRLIAGLPSNIVNGFDESSNIMYIGTNGGLGRFNITSTNDWMDSVTSNSGLQDNVIEDVLVIGTDVYLATPSGLIVWDELTETSTLMDASDGLMATSTWGLTVIPTNAPGASPVLVLSHDGRGADRPGVTMIDTGTMQVISTHRFDQLPSNTVTALTGDWWGLHIATDIGPMTHWNASSADFEDGLASYQTPTWPVEGMMSNGDELIAFSSSSATLSESRTSSHARLTSFNQGNIIDGIVTGSHVWLTTTEGLVGWQTNGQYTEVDDYTMRRAHPLTVRALTNGGGLNITDLTHPGVDITLVDPTGPYALDASKGSAGPHGIMLQNVPLIFTSSVSGAAVWARSVSVKYDATVDLSQDPNLGSTLQLALDKGMLYDNTRHVKLRLYSPSNGSMEARITYDYVRTDTPVDMEELVDRPDDGGSALTASWSLVHDEDFSRYLIFLNEGPWATVPNELSLMGQAPDKAVSLHSRLSADIETANGQPIMDGTEYYGVIVVEYTDGRWGEVSAPFGPASSSDEIPSAPLWATASAMGSNGEDGDLELEWARCTALDLARTNVYVSTSVMTDAFGRSVQTSYLPNEGNQSILSLTPAVPVWIGFTCVDEAGQENLSDVTVVGPVVPTGELNDNEAPEPIEGTLAADVADDEGGRISVNWNQSLAEDCAFYTVFMKQGGDARDDGIIGSVDGFSQAVVVNSCDDNQTIISSLDGVPLIDGQIYSIGVVAYDAWLNGNTDSVRIVTATPFQNLIGSGNAPERISSLLAFDHANDDGTAIDVVWTPSGADDFASYTVWVADQPVSDLAVAYAMFGTNPDVCGCFTFNKQWIDERTNPIELTISSALYGDGETLTDLSSSTPQLIQPDIELFVAVTVHDIKGNVHLTELAQATVTPIDNVNDETPPDRLTELELTDRPNDDGSALLLDFELSNADDIAYYNVYAATFEFAGANPNGQALTAIAFLDRNPSLPLTIDVVAGDTPVIPGQDIWVAVVAVDTSGNAHTTDLTVVKAQSIDDGVTDPGNYLPDIESVAASWDDETNIFVEWDHSTDAQVRGYHIYISDSAFEDIADATMVGDIKASNSFLITPSLFEALDNGSAWYVAVTPYDESLSKESVISVKLNALGDEDSGSTDGDGSGELSLESLLTGPNLIAAGMLIIVLLLVVLVVRSRGSSSRRSKSWELQEATWGIQDQGWGNTPNQAPPAPSSPAPAPPQGVSQQQATDIYTAANQIQGNNYGRSEYQQTQPVLQPQVRTDVFDDLLGEQTPPPSPQIDTSFLDDLL